MVGLESPLRSDNRPMPCMGMGDKARIGDEGKAAGHQVLAALLSLATGKGSPTTGKNRPPTWVA